MCINFLESRNKGYTDWLTQQVNLTSAVVLIVVEGTRGGYQDNEDEGDISVDDIGVTTGHCDGNIFSQTVPTTVVANYCMRFQYNPIHICDNFARQCKTAPQ